MFFSSCFSYCIRLILDTVVIVLFPLFVLEGTACMLDCSSCRGLQPSAETFFAHWAKKRAFHAVCAYFRPFLVFCSYFRKLNFKNSFSKHRTSGSMFSISQNVRLSVCVSVCLCVCSLLRYRLTVFLPPLPEVGCPLFLDIRNPLGKVMKEVV